MIRKLIQLRFRLLVDYFLLQDRMSSPHEISQLRDSIAASQRQRAKSVAAAVAEVEAIKDGNGINSSSTPTSDISSAAALSAPSPTAALASYMLHSAAPPLPPAILFSEDSPMRSLRGGAGANLQPTVASTSTTSTSTGFATRPIVNSNNNGLLSPQLKGILSSGSDDDVVSLTRRELRMLVSESVSQAVAEAFDAAREQNSDNIEELLAGSKDAAERQ